MKIVAASSLLASLLALAGCVEAPEERAASERPSPPPSEGPSAPRADAPSWEEIPHGLGERRRPDGKEEIDIPTIEWTSRRRCRLGNDTTLYEDAAGMACGVVINWSVSALTQGPILTVRLGTNRGGIVRPTKEGALFLGGASRQQMTHVSEFSDVSCRDVSQVVIRMTGLTSREIVLDVPDSEKTHK